MMRLGVWWLGIGVGLCPLLGQDCAPASHILPAATVSGSLDSSSCFLNDGTAYASYRLDLPVRGQIQMDLDGATAGLVLTLRDSSGIRIDSGTSIRRPIEGGNYVVLVYVVLVDAQSLNSQAQGQPVPYSIKTAFTPEPGILCSGFANIGLNQAITGTLPSAGCTTPDGTVYEAYTLTAGGAGNLNVTIASPDFTAAVVVRGSDGRALSDSANMVNVSLSASSQYVIVVSSADKTGAYQLTTAFTPADAETCRATRTFTNSDSDKGAINTSSCFVSIDGSGDQAYYNYYSLTIAQPGTVDLSAVSGDFTATLNLLDAAGNVLASDAGAGGSDQTLAVTSGVRQQLSAGNYTVQLFSDVPSGGNYSLKYLFTPGAPQPCAASAMNPGDAPTGQISLASCRTGLGWGNLYTMTLPSAGTLTLDLGSAQFASLVAIRDARDNLVVRNNAGNDVSVSHIAADLPAGAYTIVAAAKQGNGTYLLTSHFAAHGIPACAYVQSLDINGGYIQRLGAGSCRDSNGQPVDFYQFVLPSDGVVAAVMTSSEVDGYLTLLDSSGKVVRTDDNSYGSGDPLIVQYLPAGTYRLAARGAWSTAGGLYEVDVRTALGPRPPFCAPKPTVALGSTVSGTVSFSGCQYIDTFADIYQIILSSDTSIDVRLNSSDFNAYLVLLDGKGNVVDQDDDSGGDTNARLTTPLAAGAYYIVAKPSGDFTSHGNYSLSVTQAN